ncbi:MAG: hypothetical protein MJ252_28415 [archaeon]|nr:hypothetical protein [archaeon]
MSIKEAIMEIDIIMIILMEETMGTENINSKIIFTMLIRRKEEISKSLRKERILVRQKSSTVKMLLIITKNQKERKKNKRK